MPEPFVAGTFKNPPTRVHSYDSRGVYMLVDESGQGCWSDPHGRVLLPTLDIVDRILKAHGYVRDEMTVRRPDDAPLTSPGQDVSVEDAPEGDAPGGEDSPAGGESFEGVGDAPEQPEKPADPPPPASAPKPTTPPVPTNKRKKGR